MRRVVITGLGMVTPLASGVEETWARLLAGQSGAGPITRFDASHLASTYACEVPRGDGSDGTFNPDDWMEPKEQRKVDDFILYGMAAAAQAVRDAGWEPQDEDDRLRTGVMIGSGIGGLSSIADTAVLLKERGPRRVSPFFIPSRTDQSGLGAGDHPLRVQGAEPLARHRLLHRRPCHRRRRAADPVGRRRRDDRRRCRGADLRAGHRRVHRLQGAVHQARRRSQGREPPLRRGPRRVRHGRGRRRRRSGGARSRNRAGRAHLCRGAGLRACRAMPITSPPRPRTATGPNGPCARRWSGPG